MAKPLKIHVKESIKYLRSLQRQHGPLIGKRIQMLIQLKQHEENGISKRQLSDITGINHNSIVKWRKQYLKEGIEPLLKHGRVGGFKPSIVTAQEHKELQKILTNPRNGIRGYTELLSWVKKELRKDMLYITLVKYVERKFKTKIKVARKSHVKKDEDKVAAFKKTLVINARK